MTRMVFDRSEGVCEIQRPGCWYWATQSHHRITQKTGGRHGEALARSDRCSNLLHSCVPCHDIVTDSPKWAKRFEHGWSLDENQEPSQRPVQRRGELVYLADDGSFHDFETAGA